jgi:hypothetical protein
LPLAAEPVSGCILAIEAFSESSVWMRMRRGLEMICQPFCPSRSSRLRNLAALRSPQGLQHAILHFCGCLARKRYRNDLLRRIDRCQQPKVALDQEFGLTGTGRGLHDEGTGHVQRLATGPFVGGEQCDIMRHAVTLRNEKGY